MYCNCCFSLKWFLHFDTDMSAVDDEKSWGCFMQGLRPVHEHQAIGAVDQHGQRWWGETELQVPRRPRHHRETSPSSKDGGSN